MAAGKKYQIFVSSTYEDLISERDQAIKAVLEMGHIPVGMEMFSAADEEQWKIIAKHIEESDYYCVIVAHRLGSLTSEGISYTRKEYEFARASGVPTLGFILDKSVSWPPDQVDKDSASVKDLESFRQLVMEKPVAFFKTPEDLNAKMIAALVKAINISPRPGWTRLNPDVEASAVQQVLQLSAENSALRLRLEYLEERNVTDNERRIESILQRLRSLEEEVSYKYSRQDKQWSSRKVNHMFAFQVLAPSLIQEVDTDEAAGELALEIREDTTRGYWTVAVNHMRHIFADWLTLGLVQPSARRHPVSDDKNYWSLTEFGLLVHNRTRLQRLLNSDSEAPEEPDASDPDLGLDGSSARTKGSNSSG